ncbi:redox-regulated ATPase YchF [Candidatus Parcubacteria bacterium]|nr:MAG: redox-regulated ATPase YchF [Candidatus Parcubacteria bacterium]
MALGVGIIGLPNVGKSTLFNALLKRQAALAANYPFATIEPNVGVVPVPDERLEKLAEIVEKEIASPGLAMTKKVPRVPATVQFVDIAGLVKGASEGEGLGNKFLSHIREVSIIAHVVRSFEDENIIREGSVDIKSDYEMIQTELILKDLESLRSSKFKVQSSKSQLKVQSEVLNRLENELNSGIPVREMMFAKEEQELVDQMFLLSSKPEIVVLNVEEQALKNAKEIRQNYAKLLFSVTASEAKQSQKIASGSSKPRNDNIVVISARIEAELAELSEEDQKEYLKELGVEESGLERLIKKAYQELGLISFLTAGEKEVRAWTVKRGTNAQNAAGVIHTDFIKNFIKAEVVSYDEFVQLGGWKKVRELGKVRMEGRDYIMQEGDVVEFKIGR